MSDQRVIMPWQAMSVDQQRVYEDDFLSIIYQHSTELPEPRRDGVSSVTSKALDFWVARPGLFEGGVNAIEFRLGSWSTDSVERFHHTISLVVALSLEEYKKDPFKASKYIASGIGYRQHDHDGSGTGYFRKEGEEGNEPLVSREDIIKVDTFIRTVKGLNEPEDIELVPIVPTSQMTLF